ncbi:MAG: adenosylcobinamide amidohydrolase [Nitrososphaerales archaeon]
MVNIDLEIKGVKAEIEGDNFILEAEEPLKVLSSAVFNGGLKKAYTIINHQVKEESFIVRPRVYLKNLVKRLHLKEPVIGLMTGVKMSNLRFSFKSFNDVNLYVFLTAGLSYPANAGDEINLEGNLEKTSTINIIALIDARLTDSCLVNSVKTLTEAKTYQLKALDIRSKFSNKVATGTTSDAIALACTNKGKIIEYAGSATPLGKNLANACKEALKEAILAQNKIKSDRSILERLKERGIELKDLVDAGLELYHPKGEIKREEFESELMKALEDYNVSSLILAGLRLDEDLEENLIPNLKNDPLSLVSDESLGWALSNYLAGTWGVYNFLYYDRNKPQRIKKMGSFTDDVLLALIAGTLSKIRLRRFD